MGRYEVSSHLIPVVTATCPSKLNQPVIHEANGACLGSDNIAAQKYGPPLVGCALQISVERWVQLSIQHDRNESFN